MLDRHHATGGKAATVAGAVHLIDHRNFGVTGTDEIGVQRMAQPVGHRAIGRRQRLCHHLPPENPRRGFATLPCATEQIDLKLFDFQQVQQGFLGVCHVARAFA